MSLEDIVMNSKDLTDREGLDAGGFGMVSLCLHRTCGLVVLKKVYTGYKNPKDSTALLEEGKIMHRLNHERVVKLLGIVLEMENYSLVIEYMQKGNLLAVLKQVEVPVSLKGRIVLEIIEGMAYLHSQKVVHKDLKPENILVNDDFHIKIADLGLATLKTWSRLVVEETRRRSRTNSKTAEDNAGTVYYMAPEHLRSVHTRATEKTDVYSFGIVMWVIYTGKEPYEDAINNSQLINCVINDDRPRLEDLPEDCPKEAKELMQKCWAKEPKDRPMFTECDKIFRKFFTCNQEQNVERDVADIKAKFPDPRPSIQRMESLQTDCDAEPPSIQPRDQPHSLHSSQGMMTTNSENEQIFKPSFNIPAEYEEPKEEVILEKKLQVELNYHQLGSRLDNISSPSYTEFPIQSSGMDSGRVFLGEPRNNASRVSDQFARQPEIPAFLTPYNFENRVLNQDIYGPDTRQEAYLQSQAPYMSVKPWHIPAGHHEPSQVPYHSVGIGQGPGPSLVPSTPTNPVPESSVINSYNIQQQQVRYLADMAETRDKMLNLNISNTKAVQIGNNNFMSIDAERPRTIQQSRNQVNRNLSYYEQHGVFESTSLLTEKQLQFLRDNVSRKWKLFARKLGFREPEIDEIDHDYDRDGLQEKVHQTLHKWQMKEGSKNATVGKVAIALCNMEETELLDQLISLNR
ncbi:receptor-interacting serine/threonine-protein kinase 1 [Pelodytes ibericus]